MVNVPLFVTYSANGTYTWIAPPGVTSVTAVVWGAGGGGGAAASSPSGSTGGGGGAGECALDVVAVTPGSQYTVLVGTGGAGGATGSDGSPGTDSSFTGDSLTVYAHGAQQGTAGTTGDGQGGNGGTGSTNSVSADGGAGSDGTTSTNGGGGGGAGGASATVGFPGNSGSGATAGGTSGGTYQGGAGGAGAASSGPGSNGSGPGGGGGGGLNNASTQHGGGNGADGQVLITWTQSDPVTLTNASPGATVQFQAPLGATSCKAECWGAGAGGFNQQGGGSGGAIAGSTTLQPGYGNGSRAEVAALFDGYVNRNLATAAQVVYIKEGMVQTGPNTPQPVGTVHDLGAKVYVCINPSRLAYVQGGSFLTAERANVTTTCTTINAIPGINWVAVLWNEPSLFGESGVFGDGTKAKNVTQPNITTPSTVPSSGQKVTNTYGGAGGEDIYVSLTGAGISSVVTNGTQVGTAANVYLLPKLNSAGTDAGTMTITYTGTIGWTWMLTPFGPPGGVSKTQAYQNHINWHQAFAPTVRSAVPGIQIAYKVFLTSPAAAIGMFPGGPPGGVDLVMPDWYALDFVKATNAVDMFGPTNIEGVADAYGLPLGLAEWGCTEGVVPPETGPNSWASFITHFANGLNNRIANNKPICDVIFFTGLNVGGGNNVTGPTDYKIPGIQQISDIVTNAGSASTPVGGAGGGGGEYAAEGTLALSPSGLALYTLTVGAGGADGASGGNTTVAGQSVTVTAHGGSVATSTTAGGSGGSGSSNTTHHNGGAGGAGAVTFGGTTGTGGGGGGGSGGTSSAGNAGSAGSLNLGGAGGTAITGGGPGGKGGNNSQNGSPPTTGPGGGGGARGAAGSNNGTGSDGQITLSNFVTQTACQGNLQLGSLTLAGSGGGGGGGNFTLGQLSPSGTANVAGFKQVQDGSLVTSTSGTLTLTLTSNSTAGTLLTAQIVVTSLSNTTGPAGWTMLSSQAVGNSGVGHCETWMYNPSGDGKTGGNPGGIASAAWTFTGTTARGHLAEYSCSSGFVAVLNGTVGTASGSTGTTSFAVSTSSAALGGDLGIVLYEDLFTATTTATWTAPAGWAQNRVFNTGGSNLWASYWLSGLNAGTNTATAQISTSTNQTGWGAIAAVFTPVAAVTSSGSLALNPLALAATGTAVVSGGSVKCNGGLQIPSLVLQSPSLATTFPQDPLPVVVELFLNGTWTDITSYVYTRDGINITGRGRPDEASTAQPTQVTLTLDNRDGSFSPGSQGQFFPFLTRNTQIRISVVNAVTPLGAQYSGYRFWGQVPAWPPLWNITGTDVYVPITACGVLQQMSQSKYSASPLTRYYNNQINAAITPGGVGSGTLPYSPSGVAPAGYWPCEDGGQAGSFASGIPGGSPMTWTGTPSLASDSSVPGSAPFAQLSGSVWTGIPGAFSSGGVTFANPGTYLWTCPGGVTSVKAECWGGGGGGGDGQLGTSGGGGEYAADSNVAVTPGNIYTVVVGAGGSGGAGTFTHSGVFGKDGKQSTFTGDSVTVKAHGGTGGTGSGGNGGTGSGAATHHDGGGGRNGPTAGNGGSGGGGSGGSSSAGNNGNRASSNSGASGGSAVTGGGPGGSGGHGGSTSATAGSIPSPGPGGGGGGGGLNTNNNFGLAGGSGYAGQVQLTFGTTTFPPANVVRCILDIPAGGGTDQANILSFTTGGVIANAQLSYHTASGGSLQFAAHDSNNNTLFDSGIQSFGCNGTPMLVSAEITGPATPSGAGKVSWKLTAVTPGASAVVATHKGSFSTTDGVLGSVTQVNVNNTVGHVDNGSTGVGHVVVQYGVDPVLNISQSLNAHTGELAGSRFLRLCGEQNFPTAITGSPSDTPQMGPQPTGLLIELLQDCENADLGQMFELRDAFGMGYRTRVSMQNQAAGAVLDYSAGQVSPPLTPTDDELLVRNDIIAVRGSGSTTLGTSYEAIQSTGSLSVLDPPNGVGLYQYPVTVNLHKDLQLVGFATWLLTLGTVDEYRYPVITVNLASPHLADGTFGNVAALDIGDYLQIVNPPSWLPAGPINQLCFGFTETIGPMSWVIAVNAVPADPYLNPPVGGSGGGGFPTW